MLLSDDFKKGLNVTLGTKVSLFNTKLEFCESVMRKFGLQDLQRRHLLVQILPIGKIRKKVIHCEYVLTLPGVSSYIDLILFRTLFCFLRELFVSATENCSDRF